MILVTGGLASGKRTYVRSLGFSDDDFAGSADGLRPVVLDAQELVRSKEADDALLEALAAHEVVVCTEVGCGIVPIDPDELAWRERAGRLVEALAARADTVVRMVCGIPVVLKRE